MSISAALSHLRYNATHNLIPKREHTVKQKSLLTALGEITLIQWAQFWAGWLAWSCDAIDFFSVSLSVNALSAQFGKSTTKITQAITLTLLLRSAGAVIFGIISDRFGRKYPLVINLLLVCVLELGCGFVQTYSQFLAVRALFGIGMGGIWGLAASIALENLPVEARGLASGVMQQGYAVGYLIAAVIELFLVPEQKHSWRALFWCASGISFFAACVILCLPESAVFLKAKEDARIRAQRSGLPTASGAEKSRIFLRETGKMLKAHWMLCCYAVLLMTGMNFLSHGSQDLFPTYIETTKGFSTHDATVMTIIGNCGAIAGGAVAGWGSQYIGRRLTIILCVILLACFIPLWILPNSFAGLSAGAFCIQFGVQGAWGVIPIQLSEMSPPAFRATFPGVAYQVGNMVSSASSQIEATGGSHLKTTVAVPVSAQFPTGEKVVPDYATVQGILIGCVAAFVLVVTLFGPEKHGRQFEKHRAAFEEGGGDDDAEMDVDVDEDRRSPSDADRDSSDEKGKEEMIEKA
ncbi:MFS general substrate transporter [Rhodocollybia butyracea]|uniref:MFS general substrate transporter n=1 Tax=Rhodocollybia butyracea TaxID=206335 RepID=A0A9P5QAY9_9AGAR|nr:MFS general substrate transporter [Rhodocollybia butyracea]